MRAHALLRALLLAPVAAALAPAGVHAQSAVKASVEHVLVGGVSRYHHRLEGSHTANGERYHPDSMTAAHRTLPFGTWARVTNEGNGRAVVVRINDRGPFRPASRIIDLSARAADELGVTGIGRVRIELLDSAALAARTLLARLDSLVAGRARAPSLISLAPVRRVAPTFRPTIHGRRSTPTPGDRPRS